MPSAPIGSSWASGSWSDTAWESGTWANVGTAITGTIAVTAFAARCAILGETTAHGESARRIRLSRLTSTREDIPIPAEQNEDVQQSIRTVQQRLDHTSTKTRIPMPARSEPTVQQSIRAIRKRLERLP